VNFTLRELVFDEYRHLEAGAWDDRSKIRFTSRILGVGSICKHLNLTIFDVVSICDVGAGNHQITGVVHGSLVVDV
jgi:hypothetical protein